MKEPKSLHFTCFFFYVDAEVTNKYTVHNLGIYMLE